MTEEREAKIMARAQGWNYRGQPVTELTRMELLDALVTMICLSEKTREHQAVERDLWKRTRR